MIWWTGLAPWEFEFPFPGSLISAFLGLGYLAVSKGQSTWGQRPVWVGHRPGQARLWMGVGAIVAFGSISGSVSSDKYKD